LGDVFHARTSIDQDVYQATWLAFKQLAETVPYLAVMRGNHDSYDQDGGRHSLEAFKDFCTVIDEPYIEQINGLNIAAHPFTTQIEDWKLFASCVSKDTDLFLFHQGVSSGLVGAFNIAIKAEVDINDLPFDRATWCLGGHYHKHQFMEKNVAFVGSPLQHSFNERDEQKGWLAATKTGKEWGDVRHISSVNLPKFFLFESTLSFLIKAGKEPDLWLKRNFIRVRCKAHEVEKLISRFPTVQVEVVADKQDAQAPRIDQALVSDDKLLLAEYIKRSFTEGMDRAELMEIGMSLLSASND